MCMATYEEWFMCARKRGHETEAAARRQIKSLLRAHKARPDSLHAYPCDYCGKWHVGHKKPSQPGGGPASG